MLEVFPKSALSFFLILNIILLKILLPPPRGEQGATVNDWQTEEVQVN